MCKQHSDKLILRKLIPLFGHHRETVVRNLSS